MRQRLAVWAACGRNYVLGLRLALVGGLVLAVMAAVGAPADVQRGLAWLQAQVQTDGTFAGQPTPGAQQQAQCEAAATLAKLVANSPQVAPLLASLQQQGGSTEALACVQSIRKLLGQAPSGPELNVRRVPAAGYSAYAAATAASVLDSGWALASQWEVLTATERAELVGWLRSQQAADGSFAAAGRPDLLTTAVVLRALRGEASRSPAALQVAQSAATWLLGKRSAPGHWSGDVAVTAIAYEAVQPHTGDDAAIGAAVEAFLLGQQRADGSWGGDAQTTALALRGLALTAQTALDPSRSGLRIRFVDGRTAAAVSGVHVGSVSAGASTTSGADGVARVMNVAPGSYQFSASLSGYATVTVPALLQAGQVADLGTIQLVPPIAGNTAVISGIVRVLGSNAGVPDAQIQIEGRPTPTLSSGDGSYLISSVVPGTVTMTVSRVGYFGVSAQARAVAGQVLHFSPLLTPDPSGAGGTDCRIGGTILAAADLQPLAGVTVSVTGANTVTVSTDAGGSYVTPHLNQGSVSITATKPGYDTVGATSQIVCSRSGPTLVNFSPRLYPSSQTPPGANAAALNGLVLDAATNGPIAGAQVRVTPATGLPQTVASAADGRFGVTALGGATAQVQVDATGFAGVTLTYALSPLEPLDVGQIRLRRPKVQQLLPDLRVLSVAAPRQTNDSQSLRMDATVEVVVSNAGTALAPAGAVVLAFNDANANRAYEPVADGVLGQATVSASLAPGQTSAVQISLGGYLQFRDAPVYVVVDPQGAMLDANRGNNLAASSDFKLVSPQGNELAPELKWHWQASPNFPNSVQVESGILVGPFEDTNGDGKLDKRDDPRVLFVTFTLPTSDGVLRVVDGRTGAEIRSISRPGGNQMSGWPGFAAADVNGDGRAEIFMPTTNGQLMSMSVTGQVNWVTSFVSGGNGQPYGGGPSVADIDGDGNPEVLFGPYVINAASGTLKWKGAGAVNGAVIGYHSFATDLFGDGRQQVIVGPSAYAANGDLLWQRTDIGSGYAAVLKVPGLPETQIAVSAGNFAYLLSNSGATIWGPVLIGGRGAPTVADFDGDGSPDIGIAGSNRYMALRADGSILWSVPIGDGSAQTGSTSFDFNGDGTADVIYADERKLYVINGKTGAVAYSLPHSSATAGEQPVVADIDNDGHADFLVASDVYSGGSFVGVRAFQGVGNKWVPARSVWNQYSYTITNINDDLTVPRAPLPSWQAHNTFRLNKRLDGDPRAVPDLTVGYLRVADGGAAGSVLTVRVGNGGSYPTSAGAKLAVYSADPAAGPPSPATVVATAVVPDPLQPGQWLDVQIPVNRSLASLNALGRVWVVGDDDGTGKSAMADFDRSNNVHRGELPALAANLAGTVRTDRPAYAESDQAVLTATGKNLGSFPRDAQARFTLLDASGRAIETLPLTAVSSVPTGGSASFSSVLPLQGLLAGVYTVRADLVAPDGFVYAAGTTTFTLSASQAAFASARITTDRASYTSLQAVQLSTRVANSTANTPLQNLQARTEVQTSGGLVVYSQTAVVDQLAPTVARTFHYALPAATLSPGSYTAVVQLTDSQSAVLARGTTTFTVQSTQQSGAGLSGTLTVAPPVAFVGEPVQLTLQVRNASASDIASMPAVVRIVDPAASSPSGTAILVATVPVTLPDVPAGQTRMVSLTWVASGLPGQLVASASASAGAGSVNLGQANLQLVGVPRLSVEPAGLQFAPIAVGSTVQQTVTLRSSGTAPVTSPTFALGGADASQFALPQGGCVSGASLPVAGTCTLTVSYRPEAVATHQAEVRVGYGAGAVLTLALQGESQAPLFTGTLSVDRAEVEPNANLQLLYSVSNPASITSSFAGDLAVRSATGQAAGNWPLALSVRPNGTVAASQALVAPAQTGAFSASLNQTGPSGSRVLATTTFTVVDAAPPVVLGAQLRGHARVLVLLSCPVGNNGNDDPACVAQRSAAATNYLAALGIPAKVVTTQQAFRDEMRCGTYNTYWISGGSQKLDDQLVAEVREAVTRGEALIVDGVHDSRNKALHPLLGVKQNGKLPHAGHTIAFAPGGLYPAGQMATAGQPTKFDVESATAVAQALFTQSQGNQSPSPAIVSNVWGAGRSLLFAFDLVGTLPADAAQGDPVLRQAMLASAAHLATGTQTLTIGDVASVGVSVGNQGSRTYALRVEATLPAGVSATWSAPGATWTTQPGGSTRGVWNITLAGGASQQVDLQVRATAAGDHSVRLAVFGPTGSAPLQEHEINLSVRDGPSLLAATSIAVNALAPTHNADQNDKSKAVQAVAEALALHQQARYDLALVKWVAAADAIAGIASADTRAARLAVALAMEASTDALCIQRCGSAVCQ